MAIVRCNRCDKFVDLDFHSDEMIEVGGEYIHFDCATDEEQEQREVENG